VVIISIGCDATVYLRQEGWYENRKTDYYDFGSRSGIDSQGYVKTAPLYVLTTGVDINNVPVKVAGQFNIAASLPPSPGYSDLWQIIFLNVTNGYTANSIRDAATATANFSPLINVTGPIVNCPVVANGSSLSGGEIGLTHGWHQDIMFDYFDFGVTSNSPNTEYTFPTVPVTQNDIIDLIPTDAGYSDFKSIYAASPLFPGSVSTNQYKSFEDVKDDNINPQSTGVVVNRPVVSVDTDAVEDDKSSGAFRVLVSLALAVLMAVLVMS